MMRDKRSVLHDWYTQSLWRNYKQRKMFVIHAPTSATGDSDRTEVHDESAPNSGTKNDYSAPERSNAYVPGLSFKET